MNYLGIALGWKYKDAEGISTRKGKIVSWPENLGVQPTEQECAAITEEYIAATSYIENRIKEYPSLEEQMDMKFHDEINGTSVWKDTIAAIKAKYPKPE